MAITDAFGQTAPDTDPDSDGEQTVVNLRFPGQIQGGEAAYYYNYFRDYDPSLGRYIQSDPIGLQGGINTYGYAYQNPVMYTDPNGLNPAAGCLAGAWGGPVGCGVGAGIGTAIAGGIALAAILSTPGDTPTDKADKARERKEYSRICKTPIPPTGDPCTDAKNNLNRLKQCLQLRENFSRKWYNDGDAGHMTEIQNTRNAIRNLENWIQDNCGDQCE
ncbi:RHS repeat-associated core domain-containing protein [Microbulbifer thermotolerans]|uniref:RHS repeat-associated core domain-containing protein n=2 Tax=Microbulbifer thermotolerans TaxID=252514 RepID=UPI0009EE8D99|nr:RHS repeat-associated core domain-containing protein [Microbulbifer thermotolerans]MCX2784614.1 RHS repeat-associated core domain-containing protein [Microbulbifer thermotolerans]MCX2833096.1 RHS repeat-associated core domain-containing protein [Microbulbifer thermotolerans]